MFLKLFYPIRRSFRNYFKKHWLISLWDKKCAFPNCTFLWLLEHCGTGGQVVHALRNVEIVSHIKNFIVSLIKIPALFYTFPIWTSKGWQYNGLQCWWGYGISSRTLVRFSSGRIRQSKAKCTHNVGNFRSKSVISNILTHYSLHQRLHVIFKCIFIFSQCLGVEKFQLTLLFPILVKEFPFWSSSYILKLICIFYQQF